MIELNCPHCGHQLRIDDKYAGQNGKCKACGKGITVPGGDGGFEPNTEPPDINIPDIESGTSAFNAPRHAVSMQKQRSNNKVAIYVVLVIAIILGVAAIPLLTNYESTPDFPDSFYRPAIDWELTKIDQKSHCRQYLDATIWKDSDRTTPYFDEITDNYTSIFWIGVLMYINEYNIDTRTLTVLDLMELVLESDYLEEDISMPSKPKRSKFTMPFSGSVVTLAEFNSIKTGMTYQQVVQNIGTQGTIMSENEIAGYHTIMYMWQNSNGSNMNCMFQQEKLIQKAQFGLK